MELIEIKFIIIIDEDKIKIAIIIVWSWKKRSCSMTGLCLLGKLILVHISKKS